MKILLNSDIPIYKQISADFKERIMNGSIPAGEYLPSIRGLAKELKISVITTMKAYEELCSEGLVSAVQGKGYIVNPQDTGMIKEQYMRLLEQHLQDALDCARLAGMTVDETAEILKTLGSIN